MARGSVPTREVERFLNIIRAENVDDNIFKRDKVRILFQTRFQNERSTGNRYSFGQMIRQMTQSRIAHELGDYYIFGNEVQVLFERIANNSEFTNTLEDWRKTARNNPLFCEICGIVCTSERSLVEHQLGSRHRIRKLHVDIYQRRNELIRVPEGLRLECNPTIQNGRMEMVCKPGEIKTMTINIQNCVTEQGVDVVLQRHIFLWDTGMFTLYMRSGRGGHNQWSVFNRTNLHITPGETRYFEIRGKAPLEDFGHHYVPLALFFVKKSRTQQGTRSQEEMDSTQYKFLIYVSLHVLGELHDDLAPTSVYEGRENVQEYSYQVTEPGERLPENSRNGLAGRLTPFRIPPYLYNQIRKSNKAAIVNGRMKLNSRYLTDILDCRTTAENYVTKFQHLLWIEEIQLLIDIQQYNMAGVTLERLQSKMRLAVPGLVENRPSVMRGDRLYIYISDRLSERTGHPEDQLNVAIGNIVLNMECEADEQRGRRNVRYEGVVHKVELEHVLLGVSARLRRSWSIGKRYNVEFQVSPYNMWVQHRAVKLAVSYMDILFPDTVALLAEHSLIARRESIDDLNPEQQTAVRNIVQGTSRPAPYIIFGPPGTGKTETVTAAIKQVYNLHQDSRILVCCPENSAADHIMQILLTSDEPNMKEETFRMYALSRKPETLPERIIASGRHNFDRTGECFFYPTVATLMGYRIIVTTLMTAGRMVTARFPKNHFTHIFIDEGGHAVEPECIVPITGLMDPTAEHGRAQLVIAGDPKQLGPIIRSKIALNFGLPISLMERLMDDITMYKTPYNPRYITKLIRNYRSHDMILEIPRRLFYDNELQAFGDPKVLNCMLGWDMLPNSKIPIMFHSVFGTEEQAGDSPSWFNRDEIAQIDMYLTKLMSNTHHHLNSSDIGIIAPYKKQVAKIRRMLIANRHILNQNEITVGSVEEFQGREFKVIIISGVRSDMNASYTDIDYVFNLGFMRNPKRFNVAMTRARALLIVIGNPITLEQDECWKTFIDYCDENNAFKGPRPRRNNRRNNTDSAATSSTDHR
ncbi:putative helicase MOV-10 [Dreissena polymorpha]|uniref:RNA helicase n=1 Tax=Dreissena polymorpha TaxID=45954 RepID=A0A9D4FNI1_DREPO|nr:putative helicase MOV-10 [Dreissena polymorpha]KAH3800819.1 hypothetical protein DPMN_154462 [Dreissena polymorpha]